MALTSKEFSEISKTTFSEPETVVKLVSMLIKKVGIQQTLFRLGVRLTLPGTCLFPHSRELLLNAHKTISPHLINYASDRLKDDKDVVLAALQSRIRPSDMTSFIPTELTNDPDILDWT